VSLRAQVLMVASAPEPIAHSEVVKGLAESSEATDQTTPAVLNGLRTVSMLW
jgi:hypothetical protein